jgi:hypothetical protein
MPTPKSVPNIGFVDHLRVSAWFVLTSNSVACQGEIVTVYIGPEKKPYNVHEDLICYHSEYFRTAYNGQRREAEEGVVLADIESEVFNLFLHWMYTQNIPSSDYDITSIAYPSFVDDFANMDFTNFLTNFEDIVTCDFLTLRSCIFGDRFLAPKFKEAAHNAFVDLRGHNLQCKNTLFMLLSIYKRKT